MRSLRERFPRAAIVRLAPPAAPYLDILFTDNDGQPGTLVEAESPAGRSVNVPGEWIHDAEGYWRLRLPYAGGRVGA